TPCTTSSPSKTNGKTSTYTHPDATTSTSRYAPSRERTSWNGRRRNTQQYSSSVRSRPTSMTGEGRTGRSLCAPTGRQRHADPAAPLRYSEGVPPRLPNSTGRHTHTHTTATNAPHGHLSALHFQ